MGHMGIERTLDLVRSRFYWPRMSVDVVNKIRTCERCVRRKTLPDHAAPLVNIRTSRPLELVCMDYLSVEPDGRIKDILVMTDHFTKYAIAEPTPNQKATTVAKCLWDNFLVHYGIPERLHSDQGTDFESKIIKELCEMVGIHKVRTTPYHPRGNPVERFNRTLLDMLGTLSNQEKRHWKEFVKPLVHAYNCTKNDATGFSPYELMFGRQPRLPVDLAFGLPLNGENLNSHSQYVQKLKSHLEEGYKLAVENSQKLMNRNKLRFDLQVTPSELRPGDRVLVRNVRLRGKHKLADKWEPDVYIVVKKAGTLPVYTIKPEGKDKPLRTLHRDLLLPCGYLPSQEKHLPVKDTPAKKGKSLTLPPPDPAEEEADDDDSVSVVQVPASLEPLRFTTVIDLPTALPPATHLNPSPQGFTTQNDGNLREPEDEGSPSVEEEILAVETVGTGLDPELNDIEPVQSEPAEASSVEGSPPQPESPELSSSQLEPDSPLESEPTSPVQPVRRSGRSRIPPERLQYSQLGHPLLKSIQSLFNGLSSVFTFALQEDEGDEVPVNPRHSAIRCQPGPCPRTYIGIGGESVTHVN
uniref:Gypsy retrotransposon integrase-like protein 1 n=1 Tax=Gouania willdenowi TaxID=441366 RepID=A0A8C5DDY6_GOUWI